MKKLFTALLTLVLLFVLQVKAQQSCHTPIRNNTLNHLPDFCSGNMAFTVWGSLPTGGAGVFTYQWE
jgi:hypothetical protein